MYLAVWVRVAFVVSLQKLCKKCNKWFKRQRGERHSLCQSCNNARRYALSPIDNTAPVAGPSLSSALHDHDPFVLTPLTEEQRWTIVALHRDGQTRQTIAGKIPCSLKTVNHWINHHDQHLRL
ncbi:MAG: helix-turn-helix domain-containing protein [Candidatus Saccharimonadales bacterium]